MLCCTISLLVVAIGAGPEGVAMKDVVQGNNQFAFDLFGQLRSRPGNLVFSPYSISTALAMTRVGAAGSTASEMDRTLHLPAEAQVRDSGFAALTATFNNDNPQRRYELSTANALWGQEGASYRPEFLEKTQAGYGAGLRPVDFVGNPEGARKTINGWIEAKTHDRIKDLLSPSDVRPGTDLILTNAVYFKAAWASPFPKDSTEDEPFHVGGKSPKLPTMHLGGQFSYFEGADFQMLDLPYVGHELSMVLLLPRKMDGLATLEASLTPETLDGWREKFESRRVEIALPRFKIETGTELTQPLSDLGMPTAFQARADFSGIATDRKLFLSAVIHKAFAEVNEEGTEAAAATAVVMMKSMAMRLTKPPVQFRADHPFVFLIRDSRTGSILFLGRVEQPQA